MPRTCSIDGCSNQHKAKGWCNKHYQRALKHGDPTVAHPNGHKGSSHYRWSDKPSYLAAHLRVHKSLGKAADHACVDCGEEAHHWSYDHADADELSGMTPRGRVASYSAKLEHYRPRCRSCHTRFDYQNTNNANVTEEDAA